MKEADFSPDGRWIAYEGWPTGSDHDIWIMTANGTDRRPVTLDSALDFDAAWRP
jgi:eukaryotic-like serine/threonine-protein kinase